MSDLRDGHTHFEFKTISYINFIKNFFFPEHSGPAFEEFLSCIGQKVRLKGFEKYRAQLDNKSKQCCMLNCKPYYTSIIHIYILALNYC